MRWLPVFRCPACRLPVPRWRLEEQASSEVYEDHYVACENCKTAMRMSRLCTLVGLIPWGLGIAGLLWKFDELESGFLGVLAVFLAAHWVADYLMPLFAPPRVAPRGTKRKPTPTLRIRPWDVSYFFVWRSIGAATIVALVYDVPGVGWWNEGFHPGRLALWAALGVVWVYSEVIRIAAFQRWDRLAIEREKSHPARHQ